MKFYEDTQLSRLLVDGLTVIVHGARGKLINHVIAYDEAGQADPGESEATLSIALAYTYESLLFLEEETKTQIHLALRSLNNQCNRTSVETKS